MSSPPPSGNRIWLARPHSIAELAEDASASIHFSTRYSLNSWSRACDNLRKEAIAYQGMQGGEALERAFGFHVRIAKICLELLPAHPQYKDTSPEMKAELRQKGQHALSSLSAMKPSLSTRYEAWRAAHPDWQDAVELRKMQAREARSKGNGVMSRKEETREKQEETREKQEEEDRKLAERLVAVQIGEQEEEARRRRAQQEQHQHSSSSQQPPYPPYPPALQYPQQPPYPPSVQVQQNNNHHSQPHPSLTYPSIPPRSSQPSHLQHQHHNHLYSLPSSSTSNLTYLSNDRHRPSPPPQPSSRPASASSQPNLPLPSSSNPNSSSTSTSGGLMSPPSLRTVFVPPSLVTEFLKSAKKNTKKKIETCGLLLGNLSSSGFTVRVLLIPVQKGTGDTCETLEEEKIFALQDERNLISLGWIHSHPTQSCFMSSLDLHTHSAYQVMLPEAVAIVCAPTSSPDLGIFRLTDPPGLQLIMSCSRKETFHPHPDVKGGIYTGGFGVEDSGFGHVRMREGQGVEVIDLRSRWS